MEDGSQHPPRDLPGEVAALRSEIQDLKRRERKYMQEIAESEKEFGKKRALFKELYMTREEELKREKNNAKRAREEAEKLKEELQKMVAESDGFRTASALSREDELEAIHLKHQGEIASLQHIMRETVRDAETITVQKFQEERQQFVSKIQILQAQIAELHSKQSHEGDGAGQSANVLSSAMSVVSNAVRRNTNSSGTPPSTTSAEMSEDEALELSMKKAQEDAEAWRAIVMPLEQEISTLKAKLKDSQKKLQSAEAKIKASPEKVKKGAERLGSELEHGKTSAPAEDQDEKVKELSQYLEAERSSRTDLEMYVAVLNTQKGVLQEDADRLRKDMHNVCRLLEQERTAHRELKQTWQLANDQFLENQRLQDIELQRVRSVLTAEQVHRVEALRQSEPDVGQLISFDSPDASPSTTALEANDAPLSLPEPSSSMWNSISTVPCTSALASSSAGSMEEQSESEAAGVRRVHSASDVNSLDASSSEVSKTKSAENLSSPAVSPTPESSSEKRDATDAVAAPREFPQQGPPGARVRVGSAGGKIDWKIFQEAVKVSHQSDMSRTCAMCVNYERQLQEMQKFQNLSSNLQRALEQEKKALFEEQKQRSRLEESIARAAEDAQSQINMHVVAQTKLERLLTGAKENFNATRKEARSRIEDLVRSRNELEAELNKLKTDYSSLQDNAIQQLSQMDSDARVSEMKEQSMQIRAAAEHTEEKLRSEIAFLKDRAMAEQMAKDSLEEMYQGDLEGLRADLGKVKGELERETRHKQEVESHLIKAQQSQKSTEGKSQQVIIALRGQVDDANEAKIDMEQENKKLKNQLQSLNQQLNQSEAVQKDFVRLSQSLQMQIARIQESESEVRWIHPDDVSECRKCKKQLNSHTEKHHCDHCGKIFCKQCSSQTVQRSSSNRAHRVCDTCYTSLNKDSKSTFFDTSLADSQT